eukprot:c11381_g1_i3.p1 GENE.c11381_g1_i3~~c11381_g1_i3.p1  ORF type:complete len:611 (-),score=160.77 c11381_g1_i3:110-1942(-)
MQELKPLLTLAMVLVASVALPDRPDAHDPKATQQQKGVSVTPNVSDGHAFQYHDHEGLTSFIDNMANGSCSAILRKLTIGKSVQGREIWGVRITDNPDVQEDEPEFLYVGNIHGDEPVGREVLIHMIQFICDEYESGSNQYITTLVESTDMYIFPAINPDGFFAQQRENARYIDLNRNFPDQFVGGSATQPESLAIKAFVDSRFFSLGANLHGGSMVCNYPWDGTYNHQNLRMSYSPDQDLFVHLCKSYSEAHPTMRVLGPFPDGITNGAKWYYLYNGFQDYSYSQRSMLHVTLELSNIKFVAESKLQAEWNNNKEAVFRYAEQVHRGVRGRVTCVCGNSDSPAAARIQFTPLSPPPYTLEPGAMDLLTAHSDPEYGDFHRVLLPGTYMMNVSIVGCVDPLPQLVVIPQPEGDSGVALINSGSVSVIIRSQSQECSSPSSPATPSPSPSPAHSPSSPPMSASPSRVPASDSASPSRVASSESTSPSHVASPSTESASPSRVASSDSTSPSPSTTRSPYLASPIPDSSTVRLPSRYLPAIDQTGKILIAAFGVLVVVVVAVVFKLKQLQPPSANSRKAAVSVVKPGQDARGKVESNLKTAVMVDTLGVPLV